jgi:hypothetical protein
MKATFSIEGISDIHVDRTEDGVDVILIDAITGNSYVLEIPSGEVLQYLAEKLMLNHLFEQTELPELKF